MSYCFARITNYYPQLLNYLYNKTPSLINKTYSQQHDALVSDSYEIASCYVTNLKKLGVKSFDIISNASHLQRAWRTENKISNHISTQELITRQLKKNNPDVVWIDDFSFVDTNWKADLLKKVPSVKLLIGHICAPFNSELEKKFKLVDIMFTCTPCLKKQLEKIGLKTYLLYHGFEESILENIGSDNSFPETDFLFSGSLYTGSGFHNKRIEYIENIIQSGIKISIYGNLDSWKKIVAKKAFRQIVKTIKRIGAENMVEKIPLLRKYKNYGKSPVKHYSYSLIKATKSPVFGMDMYKMLSKAKIVFNMHGEVAGNCAGNIRMFEATGVGSCLVTDWKENLGELFELEKEVVTYKSIEECIDKVKWLLKNPNEREKIAIAGQKRTLSHHTISQRAELLNKIIQKELSQIYR